MVPGVARHISGVVNRKVRRENFVALKSLHHFHVYHSGTDSSACHFLVGHATITQNIKMKDTTSKMEDNSEVLATRYVNLGVAYYEKGQIQEAIVAFTDALSMARHIVEAPGDDLAYVETNLYAPIGPFAPQFGQCEKIKFPSSEISLFLNPIKIKDKLPRRRISKTLSLVSLFNLAICNHRKAIARQLDRSLLIRTLQLYEMAYSIQMREGIDMTLTPTMIIMSNVGHIHDVMGNIDNATECFQHLLSTLMFLLEAGERDMVWEYDGFFENILKTVYPHPPASAA
jgi:tetratricopeptide (TPR) repeat protein